MKRIICVLPLLIASISPAIANSDNIKISTIKNMYNQAIKSIRSEQYEDTLDILFKYADRDLQNAVAISKMNRHDEDGALTYCFGGAYEILSLGVTNSWGIDEAKWREYKVLKNGRVRATITYQENINTAKFTGYKDFSLQCTGSSCKVTDVHNDTGLSGKIGAEKLCR